MSCNLIYVKDGKKTARPVTSEEEYRSIRNGATQIANLNVARSGNSKAKMRLVQFNYSGHYPNGLVKGNKLPGKAFGFDIDDKDEFDRVSTLLLADPQRFQLLMLERSANQGGHAVFVREQGKTILENQVRIASLLDCEMDTNAHDINRVYFTTSAHPDDLLFVSPLLFADQYDEAEVREEAVRLADRERYGEEELPEGAHNGNKHFRPNAPQQQQEDTSGQEEKEEPSKGDEPETVHVDGQGDAGDLCYLGIPYGIIISKWWDLYNYGQTPVRSNRDVLTFELAVNLRHICGFDRELMNRVIPCYDGFSEQQKMKCIDSALAERRTQMPKRLKDVLLALQHEALNGRSGELNEDSAMAIDDALSQNDLYYVDRLPELPQGVSDSVEAAGKPLTMATLIAIAPAIGALATDVKLDVHGVKRGLNLMSYICGEFASGKGQIDPIVETWMKELQDEADIYTAQEREWAQTARRMKSGKAPEQPSFPIRILPLNNTLANIAERLGNTEGKHSFSFTPEADTVAQKWKSTISDFSVMLRQAYDESRYDREAKSADAARVHIKNLKWNLTMCGTPDALYRVISNYTDGLLSRIAIASTPDNTFARLDDNPAILTEEHSARILQIAHMLPLMRGVVELEKLEARCREWLEKVRLEALKNDDRVFAKMRIRTCINAMRITCALQLPAVAERLIEQHGLYGAETALKQDASLTAEVLTDLQNDDMLNLFDTIADYLLDNDMFYFKEKIEAAMESKDYTGNLRSKAGVNDNIFSRLPNEFTFDQAYQEALQIKGRNIAKNSVHLMLRNWKKQGLVIGIEKGRYRKIS